MSMWLPDNRLLLEPNLLEPEKRPVGLVETNRSAKVCGLVYMTLFNRLIVGSNQGEYVFDGDGTGLHPGYMNFSATTFQTANQDGLLLPDISGHFTDEATLIMRLRRVGTANCGLVTLDLVTGISSASHYPYAGNILFGIFKNDTRISYSSSGIDITSWHWLVVRSKPGANGYKVDSHGVNRISTTGLSSIYIPTDPVIGYSRKEVAPTTDRYSFEGDIASCHLFNRCLSDTEVALVQSDPFQFLTPAR